MDPADNQLAAKRNNELFQRSLLAARLERYASNQSTYMLEEANESASDEWIPDNTTLSLENTDPVVSSNLSEEFRDDELAELSDRAALDARVTPEYEPLVSRLLWEDFRDDELAELSVILPELDGLMRKTDKSPTSSIDDVTGDGMDQTESSSFLLVRMISCE